VSAVSTIIAIPIVQIVRRVIGTRSTHHLGAGSSACNDLGRFSRSYLDADLPVASKPIPTALVAAPTPAADSEEDLDVPSDDMSARSASPFTTL
jgi:hypothetical protein